MNKKIHKIQGLIIHIFLTHPFLQVAIPTSVSFIPTPENKNIILIALYLQ